MGTFGFRVWGLNQKPNPKTSDVFEDIVLRLQVGFPESTVLLLWLRSPLPFSNHRL